MHPFCVLLLVALLPLLCRGVRRECEDDACHAYYMEELDAQDLFSGGVGMGGDECSEVVWQRPLRDGELESLQRAFDATGIVQLPSFLLEEHFERLHSALYKHVHSEVFGDLTWGPDRRPLFVPRTLANAAKTAEIRRMGLENRAKSIYTALFERTTPAVHSKLRRHYWEVFDGVHEFLQSREMITLLERITGHKYELNTFFFSRYNVGDFLTVHHDTMPHRQLAFTVQLTRDWKEEYGGNLQFFEKDEKTVMAQLTPEANTFTFFNVKDRILPHAVTEVQSSAPHARIALTGWYQYVGVSKPFSFDNYESFKDKGRS